jgi:hypothetical protein
MLMRTGRITAGSAIVIGCAVLTLLPRAYGQTVVLDQPSVAATLDLQLHPKSSTLGAGTEYRLRLSENFAFRVDDYLVGAQTNSGDTFYRSDVRATLRSRMAGFDWRPFSGIFHTSAGLSFNRYKVDASAMTAGEFVPHEIIGETGMGLLAQYFGDYPDFQRYANTPIDISGVLTTSATVSWNRVAPYVGFGWNNYDVKPRGLFYSVDLSAIYIGRPDVDLKLSGPVIEEVERYYAGELRTYLAEQERQMEKQLDTYRVIPALSIGIAYRF